MIPKEYRLKHMKGFDILFKEGRFVNDELVSIKIWHIDPEKYPRREYTMDTLKIGFVVGLKVSKSAVKRNRLKRQMREVVRLLLKDGKINSGYLIAIIAKDEALGAEYSDIEKSIHSALKKARLLSA